MNELSHWFNLRDLSLVGFKLAHLKNIPARLNNLVVSTVEIAFDNLVALLAGSAAHRVFMRVGVVANSDLEVGAKNVNAEVNVHFLHELDCAQVNGEEGVGLVISDSEGVPDDVLFSVDTSSLPINSILSFVGSCWLISRR